MVTFNIAYPVPVIFGNGVCLQTGKKLKEKGISKVLCLYDQGIKAAGITERILAGIKAEGIEVIEFAEVLPDPADTLIDAAGEIGREKRVDGVLGIGGGSSLDAAKAVNVLLGNSGSIQLYYDISVAQNPGKPLFLIPTTAGTGSEVTGVAVLSNTRTNRKQGVVGKNCLATLAIVDPTLTYGLPSPITAATGMDTLAHAVEAFTSAMHNSMSDILAKEAISLVTRYLPLAVSDGSNTEARFKLSFASTVAGMAFSNAFPHLGHAIGHTIGGTHHIPHGIACGLAIPCVIEYVADILPEKVRAVGEAMGMDLQNNLSHEKLAMQVGDKVRQLIREICLPSFKQMQILESDLPFIAQEALLDVSARNIPKKANAEDILKLLQREFIL